MFIVGMCTNNFLSSLSAVQHTDLNPRVSQTNIGRNHTGATSKTPNDPAMMPLTKRNRMFVLMEKGREKERNPSPIPTFVQNRNLVPASLRMERSSGDNSD